MPCPQLVRERRDELEREAPLVAHLNECLQDFREIYVPQAGGEAIGVGEVDVVEKVAVGQDGA